MPGPLICISTVLTLFVAIMGRTNTEGAEAGEEGMSISNPGLCFLLGLGVGGDLDLETRENMLAII